MFCEHLSQCEPHSNHTLTCSCALVFFIGVHFFTGTSAFPKQTSLLALKYQTPSFSVSYFPSKSSIGSIAHWCFVVGDFFFGGFSWAYYNIPIYECIYIYMIYTYIPVHTYMYIFSVDLNSFKRTGLFPGGFLHQPNGRGSPPKGGRGRLRPRGRRGVGGRAEGSWLHPGDRQRPGWTSSSRWWQLQHFLIFT